MARGNRAISNVFLDALKKDDVFKELIRAVKNDKDLCLELRDEKPALYYRGKKMFDIKLVKGKVHYIFNDSVKPKALRIKLDVYPDDVLKNLELYKGYVDRRLEEINRKYLEGRYQYRLAHFNGICHGDDDLYCIADIEYYQENRNNWHFDLVALNSEDKSSPFFTFIEVKYGASTLRTKEGKDGNPGIRKHLVDFKKVSDKKESMLLMKKDLEKVLLQKAELGIVQTKNNLTVKCCKTEYLFVIFNYTTNSKQLRNELDDIMRNHKQLYVDCKDRTYFAFINNCDDSRQYKLNKSNFLTFEEVVQRYSSIKK